MKGFVKTFFLFYLIIGVAVSVLAAEEPYPSRPVNMFHAYAAAGSTDLAARAIAAVAPKYFSQPIIVVPKPGGAGLVALQALASAKPDGYTYHLGRNGELTNGPFIEKIPFDVEKDFIPVAQVALDYVVFAVYAKTPWKTIDELIADVETHRIRLLRYRTCKVTRPGRGGQWDSGRQRVASLPREGSWCRRRDSNPHDLAIGGF